MVSEPPAIPNHAIPVHMRLSLFHDCQAIRLWEKGFVPELTAQEFYTCCNVVSRKDSGTEELTWCPDEELRESLDQMKAELPKDFAWPHRGGLVQVLNRGATAWLTNVKVDVTTHLADRMIRWIVVRLSVAIDQAGGTEDHLWTIARHIVATMTWDEDKEVDQ